MFTVKDPVLFQSASYDLCFNVICQTLVNPTRLAVQNTKIKPGKPGFGSVVNYKSSSPPNYMPQARLVARQAAGISWHHCL